MTGNRRAPHPTLSPMGRGEKGEIEILNRGVSGGEARRG